MNEKLALVTGASSGIGEATVRQLIERGDRVIALGTNRAALEELAAKPESQQRVIPLAVDLTNRADLAKAITTCGAIDTLVLSAGICEQARIDEEADDATWFRVLDVNLHGVYFTIKAALPNMRSCGRIVVVSSGLGKLGRAGYSAYAAAKHGVLGLTKCLSKELAPRGITVNAVCPGWVDTPMARADIAKNAIAIGQSEKLCREQSEELIPTGRWVSADEVASLILFLASPAAASITGEAYNISGGEFFA